MWVPGSQFYAVLELDDLRGTTGRVPLRDVSLSLRAGDVLAITSCAYCGVGCSFRAEMRGEELPTPQ